MDARWTGQQPFARAHRIQFGFPYRVPVYVGHGFGLGRAIHGDNTGVGCNLLDALEQIRENRRTTGVDPPQAIQSTSMGFAVLHQSSEERRRSRTARNTQLLNLSNHRVGLDASGKAQIRLRNHAGQTGGQIGQQEYRQGGDTNGR